METSTYGHITDWNEVLKKEARGLNDADLGKVQEVNENFVITERGTINKVLPSQDHSTWIQWSYFAF
jgi:hypothetical protein